MAVFLLFAVACKINVCRPTQVAFRVEQLYVNVRVRHRYFVAAESLHGGTGRLLNGNPKIASNSYGKTVLFGTGIHGAGVDDHPWSMNHNADFRPEHRYRFPCVRGGRDNARVLESNYQPIKALAGFCERRDHYYKEFVDELLVNLI